MKNTATTADSTSTQKCLCGASTVGSWTSGHHHGAHRCALVITNLERAETYARIRTRYEGR